MSDDEDEMQMDFSMDQGGSEGHDMMGFGPLLPTESERSLMERVRQELKIELKQVKIYVHESYIIAAVMLILILSHWFCDAK